MVKEHNVQGYENFIKLVESLKEKTVIHVFLSGSENGEIWCPGCKVALPLVKKCLEKVADDAQFIYVEINQKCGVSPKCPFKKDPNLKLMKVPTLLKWKKPQRLEGSECSKPDLLELYFNED